MTKTYYVINKYTTFANNNETIKEPYRYFEDESYALNFLKKLTPQVSDSKKVKWSFSKELETIQLDENGLNEILNKYKYAKLMKSENKTFNDTDLF